MKVVINDDWGGFSLSKEAVKKLIEYGHENSNDYKEYISEMDKGDYKFNSCYIYIKRNDPLLVKVVEELGETAEGMNAKLKIVEIPDNVEFEISDYDGMETIHELHRMWR